MAILNRKPNIVIVDDEQNILTMLERYFSREADCSVRTFSNPVTALSNIKSDTDLVLLDIMMPQMDGLELLAKLQEKYPDIKVVMMTAYSTLDKVLKAHRHGATHYVMKPFSSLDALKRKVDEVLAD
jgi:DNA-binding NtrC family response regulator